MLALWLEHKFTKDQILEIYLNRVYLGAGTYGVDAAAQRYFDKPAQGLDALRGGGDRRAVEGADALQPGATTARRAADRAASGARQHGGRGLPHRAAGGARRRARSTQLARVIAESRAGSRYFADWVAEQVDAFHRTGKRDRRHHHHPRSAHAGRGASTAVADTLDRDGEKSEVEPGRARRDVARRRGPRHGRRTRLRRQPVQPRDPGAAPARLLLQAFVYLAALEHGMRSRATTSWTRPIRIGN